MAESTAPPHAPPPGARGLPRLGHTLELIGDPRGFFERRKQRYGDVLTSRAHLQRWAEHGGETVRLRARQS